MLKNFMNKHRIIGLIVLLAVIVMGVQFLLSYQKIGGLHTRLQAYRSPPVPPLQPEMTSPEHAPAIQSADALMQERFDTTADPVPAVPAWIVQVASLSTETSAQILLAQLQKLGLDAFIYASSSQGQPSYRVCAGPFTQQQVAVAALSTIAKSLKITGILKQYTPVDSTEPGSQSTPA